MKWLRLWPIGLVIVGSVVILAAQQPVTVVGTMPLPTGAATATLQTTGNTSLASIDTKLMAAAALADGTSNPTTTGMASFNMCWNGATWDRCKAATGGNGTTDSNTARVTLSSDSTGQVKVTNLPTTVTTNNGTVDASSVRVTIASDSTGQIKATNLPTTVTLNSGASDASTLRVSPDPWMGGSLVKGTTGSMTATTSTSVISAVASNYIYVTQCVITQSSTTVGTAVNLQDGSGGSTIYTLPAPAAANSVVVTGAVIPFPTPIRVPTIGNALFAVNGTTGSAVILSCSGFASTVSR